MLSITKAFTLQLNQGGMQRAPPLCASQPEGMSTSDKSSLLGMPGIHSAIQPFSLGCAPRMWRSGTSVLRPEKS